MKRTFTDAEIQAAAQQLNRVGLFHHWFTGPADYREMDPISRREFEAIVEEILGAAASAPSAA